MHIQVVMEDRGQYAWFFQLRSEEPLKMAIQGLGHSSIATTENYFAGFESEAQAEFAKALTTF